MRAVQNEPSGVFGLFREEASEHIQHIHRGLLALQHQPADGVMLREIGLSADVLIGSAITIGLDEIGQNARTIRDLLVAARDGRSRLDESKLALLFQNLEAMSARLDEATRDKRGDEAGGVPQATVFAARTCVDQLYQGLVRLEDHPADSVVLREVRPLARTLRTQCDKRELEGVARIAQRIEHVLQAAEDGVLEINQEFLGLLLQGLGFMEILLDAAATGVESGVQAEDLCERLYGKIPIAGTEGVDTGSVVSSDSLPAANVAESTGAPEAGRGVSERGVAKKKAVLIASNSALFSGALLDAMRQKDLEVVLAADANELVSHLGERDVDLCFLRDSLPNALEICERFSSSSEEASSIPIIVYSPLSRAQHRALEKGASAFLKVPCRPKEVAALVDRWIRHTPGSP